MRCLASLAMFSMAGLSHARLPGLEPRRPADECCPCPGLGEPAAQDPVTVTVTAAAPAAQTVYVSGAPKETVTVNNTKSAATIYVTKESDHEPVTEQVINAEDQVVTKVVQPQEPPQGPPKGPQTVTVNIQPAEEQTATVKPSHDSQPTRQVVTVTQQPEAPSPVAPVENTEEKVVIKTVPHPEAEKPTSVPEQMAPEPQKSKTIITSVEPSIQTVTRDGQVTTTTIKSPSSVTVTAAPETVVQNVEHYQTVTQTVSKGNGNIDVAITIINIDTGETKCVMENSGLPCDDGTSTRSNPITETTSCPPVTESASIATSFNTVTVTVGQQGMSRNGTAVMGVAQPTAGLRARVPRAPMSIWW